MQCSFDIFQILHLTATLPVLFLISMDILKSINFIHLKTDSVTHKEILVCITLMVCTIKILNTWLNTLMIITDYYPQKETIVIIKSSAETTKQDKETSNEPKESNEESEKDIPEQNETNNTDGKN